VGTIFEDSPSGLDKWLLAIWQLANCNGISSYELYRAIGVTQKSAQFMLHRIRLAMQTGSFKKLSCEVEADKTFIGVLEKNKHKSGRLNKGRGTVGKAIVAGMLECVGGVVARVVPNISAPVLQSAVRDAVEPGSDPFTGSHGGYYDLSSEYKHAVVDHAVEYAWDHVIHTVFRKDRKRRRKI
jgi:hypothetical protein